MLPGPMNSTRNGFLLQTNRTVANDVAHVLGSVGKEALRSTPDVLFRDIFNCYSTLKHLCESPSYIDCEGCDSVTTAVTSWDNISLAQFLDLASRNEVKGLSPSDNEKESLRILGESLRHAHGVTNESSAPAGN